RVLLRGARGPRLLPPGAARGPPRGTAQLLQLLQRPRTLLRLRGGGALEARGLLERLPQQLLGPGRRRGQQLLLAGAQPLDLLAQDRGLRDGQVGAPARLVALRRERGPLLLERGQQRLK